VQVENSKKGAASDSTPSGRPPPCSASSPEIQASIAKLELQGRSVGRRNRCLAVVFAVGLLLFLAALGWLYRSAVQSYAVLDHVEIARNPASQGALQVRFDVVSPGKVFYRRTSGKIRTELIDYFEKPGPVQRAWTWLYEPGKSIEVSLYYRRGLFRRVESRAFPTARQADIVILMDTTGSMGRYIRTLQEKCVAFSRQLKRQSLEHRFALIGFGDTNEGEWLDEHEFTGDVAKFQQSVANLKRFDGGDIPESALDAVEVALKLPFQRDAIRRFYLVSDAPFHAPTKSGATVAQIVAALSRQQVLLNVFSRPECAKDYAPLLGDAGRFREMEEFGRLLEEGRALED
jgi:hypothetical protein